MNINKQLAYIKFKEHLIKNDVKYLTKPKTIKKDFCTLKLLYVNMDNGLIESSTVTLDHIEVRSVQLSRLGGGLDSVYTFAVTGWKDAYDTSDYIYFYKMDYNRLWVIVK